MEEYKEEKVINCSVLAIMIPSILLVAIFYAGQFLIIILSFEEVYQCNSGSNSSGIIAWSSSILFLITSLQYLFISVYEKYKCKKFLHLLSIITALAIILSFILKRAYQCDHMNWFNVLLVIDFIISVCAMILYLQTCYIKLEDKRVQRKIQQQENDKDWEGKGSVEKEAEIEGKEKVEEQV